LVFARGVGRARSGTTTRVHDIFVGVRALLGAWLIVAFAGHAASAEPRCGKVPPASKAACRRAESAADALLRAETVDDDAIGLAGGPGQTVDRLIAINRLGEQARPIWARLLRSRSPVARASAAIGLRAKDDAWSRERLAVLARDPAPADWSSGCMTAPQSVAWFTHADLAIVAQVREGRESPPAPPSATEPRPVRDALDKSDVVGAIHPHQLAVQRCARRTKTTAVVYVKLTFAPQGGLSSVKLVGPLADTPVARCLERALQDIRSPPFSGEAQVVSYPFNLDAARYEPALVKQLD
jgi:hypothetical protein